MKELGITEFRDTIIVHGPPGAGKGTAADRFASEHSYSQHISAGDTVRVISRGELESRSTEAIRLATERGLLMTDDTSTDSMLEAIGANTSASLSLIDGYPQRKGELDTLMLRAKIAIKTPEGALSLGNRHFIKWPSNHGDAYIWEPDIGRPVASIITVQKR